MIDNHPIPLDVTPVIELTLAQGKLFGKRKCAECEEADRAMLVYALGTALRRYNFEIVRKVKG